MKTPNQLTPPTKPIFSFEQLILAEIQAANLLRISKNLCGDLKRFLSFKLNKKTKLILDLSLSYFIITKMIQQIVMVLSTL